MSSVREKLILRTNLCPGDTLMLTAALRDLHHSYPARYETDVRTPFPALWKNNPYLSPLCESGNNVRILDCHYPLVNNSNNQSSHFLQGYIEYLNDSLDLNIRLSCFKGTIFLSSTERSMPIVFDGQDLSHLEGYWIIVAGGKYDYTTKWWSHTRFQKVVDHFRNTLTFVQVGNLTDYHPKLDHAIDLRGKTGLRDLIRLMYHAKGVLTPVTFMMHLSAAVDPPPSPTMLKRPCVVVAGGREPPHWEAYPTHQFIHTVGMLKCCRSGGCWKARVRALGDGDEKDLQENLCTDVVNDLPNCMNLIRASDVIRRIELYLESRAALQPNRK